MPSCPPWDTDTRHSTTVLLSLSHPFSLFLFLSFSPSPPPPPPLRLRLRLLLLSLSHSCSVTELASAGLAISFTNVFGLSIGWGIATGYDTLGSQANGTGDTRMVGVLAQRSLLLMALAMLPLFGLWINCAALLRALGFDPQVAALCGRYCLMAMPMLPGCYITVIGSKFLQVQSRVMPLVAVAAIANILHAILCYTLVVAAGLGLDGSVMALVAANWLTAVLTVGTVRWFGVGAECWYSRLELDFDHLHTTNLSLGSRRDMLYPVPMLPPPPHGGHLHTGRRRAVIVRPGRAAGGRDSTPGQGRRGP